LEEDTPITGGSTALRRMKYVKSRELDNQIVIPSTPAAVTPDPPNPALEELKDPDSAPVIDPTQISPPKKYRHRFRYRLAQFSTIISICNTAAAVIAIAFSDHWVATVIVMLAVAAGIIAVYLGMRSRMASRIVGSAMAAAALSILTMLIVLALPAHWFDERHPEQIPQHGETRPVRPN